MNTEHRDTAAAAGQVPTCPMCGRTSHGFACDGLVTEDAKRQAAAAGQVSAVHPWNTMSLNQSQEAAAGQVPAEAVEAAVETYGRMALQEGIDWTDCLRAALAAAAPLIVAAQQDTVEQASSVVTSGNTDWEEAVEAAAEALYEAHITGDHATWRELCGRHPETAQAWRSRAASALAAAAPLIVADRDATIDALEAELWAAEDTIQRLEGAIKALDDGFAKHGDHIVRLIAENQGLRDLLAQSGWQEGSTIVIAPGVSSVALTNEDDIPGGPR